MRLSAMDLLTTDSILYADGARTLTHLDHHMGNTAILYVMCRAIIRATGGAVTLNRWNRLRRCLIACCALLPTPFTWISWRYLQKRSPLKRRLPLFPARFAQSLASVLEKVERDSPHEQRLDLFCKTVLLLQDGLSSSFRALFSSLSALPIPQVVHFLKEVQALDSMNWAQQEPSFEEGRMFLFRLLYRLVIP